MNSLQNTDFDQSNSYTQGQSLNEKALEAMGLNRYATSEDAILAAKEYAGLNDFDLSQYPYLSEVFNTPTQQNAELVIEHYTNVATNIQSLMEKLKN